MIFQHFNLMSAKTVWQNVELPLKVAGVPKLQREQKVRELLELVGLKENVLQTLVLDARKVELIHKRDLKIRELEEVLRREEEKEQQLIAASKNRYPPGVLGPIGGVEVTDWP